MILGDFAGLLYGASLRETIPGTKTLFRPKTQSPAKAPGSLFSRVLMLIWTPASDEQSLRCTWKKLPAFPAVQYQTPASIYRASLCYR